jgi:hypothetical protein
MTALQPFSSFDSALNISSNKYNQYRDIFYTSRHKPSPWINLLCNPTSQLIKIPVTSSAGSITAWGLYNVRLKVAQEFDFYQTNKGCKALVSIPELGRFSNSNSENIRKGK